MRLITVRYEAGTPRVRSRCPDGQFWFMLRGGWTTRIPGRPESESVPFSLNYHLPGEKNRQTVGRGGASAFGIQVPYSLLISPSFGLLRPADPVFENRGRTGLIAAQIFRAFQEGDSASELMIEELVPSLLAVASGKAVRPGEKRESRRLAWVEALLHDRCAEPLTLSEIAAAGDLHPVYLTAAFRKRYGCTIGEYLRRLRLETASRQLCATEREIGEIAHEAGFYDQAHFNRLFKARIGVSPSVFRQWTRRL